MPDQRVMLSLEFRLGLDIEQYRVLKLVAKVFYCVPGEEEAPNAVAFILQEYGLRGCRVIFEKVVKDPTIVERIDNLDQLMLS